MRCFVAGKHQKTLENNLYAVRYPRGEHEVNERKLSQTPVNTLFCDQKTPAKQRKTMCFQVVNHAVNTSKTVCFPAVHRRGKLSDNGTNTRVHRQENKRKTSNFTIGKRKQMYATQCILHC